MPKKQQNSVYLARNEKISEAMKLMHLKKKEDAIKAKELEDNLSKRFISISNYRDVQKTQFTSITAKIVSDALNSTIQGYLMTWSDFCDFMLDRDSEIKAMVNVRTHAITSKMLVIEPSNQTIEAKQAADFVRDQLSQIPELDKTIRQMLMAIFKGIATSEILWRNDAATNTWHVERIIPVSQRRLKIRLMPVDNDGNHYQTNAGLGFGDWTVTYWNYGDNSYGEGIDMEVMFPSKYLLFSPGDEIEYQYRGLFRSIAYAFFFKQSGLAFWASGIEKFAFPVTWASVPKQTEDNVRYQLVHNLNNLANDAAVVLDEGVEINTISTGTTGGDNAYKAFVEYWDTRIRKLILGNDLTTEAGSGSANFANGKVGERMTEGLVYADACSLAETLKFQLVKYILEYNTEKFGGIMPPIPNVYFDLTNKETLPIDQVMVDSGKLKTNELRKAYGLSLLTKEEGGEEFVKSSMDTMMNPPPMGLISNGGAFQDASTAYSKDKLMSLLMSIANKIESQES